MDLNDKIWNPWHGCHRCSEGCQNCYAYFLNKRYGRDTNEVVKNKSDFTLPNKKDRNGNWKLPSGISSPWMARSTRSATALNRWCRH